MPLIINIISVRSGDPIKVFTYCPYNQHTARFGCYDELNHISLIKYCLHEVKFNQHSS